MTTYEDTRFKRNGSRAIGKSPTNSSRRVCVAAGRRTLGQRKKSCSIDSDATDVGTSANSFTRETIFKEAR